MTKTIEVGLLSRELTRQKKGRTMWRAVLEVLDRYQDLEMLVCAGFTTANYEQLNKIREASRLSNTLIACELNMAASKGKKKTKRKKKGAHLYWIHRGQRVLVAPQAFFNSGSTLADARNALKAWRNRLKRQPAKPPHMLWIHCGEIFVFKNGARKKQTLPRFKKVGQSVNKVLAKSDLVINPMHDRMARPQHNDGIGQKLSQMQPGPSVYLRVTNWDSSKGQMRDLASLHKAFVAGQPDTLNEKVIIGNEYLFSRAEITFTPQENS